MRSKFSTIVFSQGWLDGQFESLVNQSAEKANEDPTAHLIASQMQEQWTVISNAVDDLIRENTELNRKLEGVKAAIL